MDQSGDITVLLEAARAGDRGALDDVLATLYRELHEEVGLRREDVEILACTRGWLRYRLPHRLVRHNSVPLCVGQKQKWFLLRLRSDDNKVCLNNGGRAEFDDWRPQCLNSDREFEY